MNIKMLLNCEKCALHKYRERVVLGRGETPASMLFLGQAPSLVDDEAGKAFQGIAGSLLNTIIDDAYYESLFKKNKLNKPSFHCLQIVLCIPSDSYSEKGRKPNQLEIMTCKENITEIINSVQPLVIIFLGDLVEKFYKNEVASYYRIADVNSILNQGGIVSPYYNRYVKVVTSAMNLIYPICKGEF